MVCRSTPGNSAITTLARVSSNLHDVQVLSLFHEVRSEAPRSTTLPEERERNRFITGAYQRVYTVGLSDRRREDLGNRFDAARSQDVDARTYYAWRNIEERAVLARAAMDTHFAEIARRHRCTPEQAETAFNELMNRDHRIDNEVPQAPEHVRFSTTHLPRDRGTRYALAMLHLEGPRVTSSMNHLRTAYRRIHDDSAHIANNPHLDPANQCPDCGQFAGADHVCPHNAALAESHTDHVAAAEAATEALYVRNQGFVPEETGTADRVADAAGEAPSSSTEVGERHALPTEQQLLRSARQQVTPSADGRRWIAPDGTLYTDRGTAVRSVANEIRDRELRSALRAELGSDEAVTAFLSASDLDRMRLMGGNYLTNDGQRFSRYEDAVLHAYYVGRDGLAANCPTCGQFMGEGHTCPEADPLAEWEREILTGELNEIITTLDEALAEAPPAPETPTQTTPQGERQRNPMRTYRAADESGTSVRMMNVSAVRAMDANTTQTLDDINVGFTQNPDGTPGTAMVSGSLSVLNTGLRRTRTRDRYTVSEITDEHSMDGTTRRSLRCTCPDYAANYDCQHVRQAVENVSAIINQRDPVAVAPAAAMEAVSADLREEFDASLASSQAARADFDATTDTSYGQDMSAFQSSWDEAKAHFDSGETALPYMYENATNGLGAREGGRSIGIEIEVDFPDDMTYTVKEQVAREIYEAGLSDSPQVRPWHWRARQTDTRGRSMGGGYTDNPNMWSVEFDRSVDDVGGQRGCEIVSPILYDTPETWRNLKTICDIVERNGGKVTPRTGLHINIGAADFDHTVGNHNRLIGIANAYEDVIVRASHNPQAGPQHRGREYCRPMTMPEEGFTSILQAQRSIDPQNYEGSSHRAMINLDHVPAEGAPVQNSTRVEVRIFDGTIDPGRIQANVKMSLGMVDAAVRGVEVPRDAERAGTHRSRNVGSNGRMRRLSGEAWENDTESFRRFADTIFSRAEDKKQLTYAFAASRWQRR